MIKTKTVHAIFDGKQSLWDVLDEFSGKVEGPDDWSQEHDHYVYGVPKRKKKDSIT